MYFIYFWFGCATDLSNSISTTPTTSATSNSSTKSSITPVTTLLTNFSPSITPLGTIDLSEEFGAEMKGWTYRLRHIENPSGSAFTLSTDTGWALISDGGLVESGIVPSMTPYNQCEAGCRLIVADLVKDSPSTVPQIPFAEQEVSDGEPHDSVGLTVLNTWDAPLSRVPILQKKLRFRAVRLSENGQVGQHKHASRPSFAYVLSGSVTEHRGDGDVLHQSSGVVAERNGLVHWWENGSEPTVILVFDIIDA